MSYPCTCKQPCFDVEYFLDQQKWSTETFGPGPRKGVIDHIRKELVEVEENGIGDLEEWIDVIVLAFDGALRTDADPEAIIWAVKDKMEINRARSWLEWRTASPDRAIEHIRDGE